MGRIIREHTGLTFNDYMNRKRIDDWAAEGSLTLGQRTMNKTKSLLVSYSPRALKDDVVAELDKIAG